MKKVYTLTWAFLLHFLVSNAQTPLATTVHDVVLTTTTEFSSVKTGVAYNPTRNLYYGNAAGVSSYMFETFSATGTSVAAVVGNVDMRGMWWNPLLGQLELNGYGSSGIHQKPLDANGYATATNIAIHNPNTNPDAQANAHYDWNNNHFIYMVSGVITRVSRATNTTVSTNAITGLPAGTTLTNWAVGYTGVSGYEIILYSYSNKKAILVNGSTHAYAGETQLPANAITTTQYNVGYANKRLFLYNTSDRKWYGYLIFPENCSGAPNAGIATVAASEVICGQPATLTLVNAASGTGISYQWQMDNGSGWTNFGTSNTNVTSPNITAATIFKCVVTCTSTQSGVSSSNTVAVTQRPIALNIGNDTTICLGTSRTINATSSNVSSYIWNNTQTTPSITVANPGTYSVIVNYTNSCVSHDTITVFPGVEPTNILATSYDLCVDSVITLNAGNVGSSYLWTPSNETTRTIDVITAGTKNLAITSRDRCVLNVSTNVISRPRPQLSLPVESFICIGDSVLIDATTPLGYTYLWSNGATSSLIYAKDTGTYHVVVNSSYNCPSWDSSLVNYLPDPVIEGFTYIPDLFEDLGTVKFAIINPQNVNSLLWDFGDGNTSVQVEPTHTYDTLGEYVVKLTVTNTCNANVYYQTININHGTGIGHLSSDEFKIYPIPTQNTITISSIASHHLKQVQLYNVVGALVYQSNPKSKEHKIDVSHFANGIYVLQLTTAEGKTAIKKIEVRK